MGVVFGPFLGFVAGWSPLVAWAVFMVSSSILAATATLILISPTPCERPGRRRLREVPGRNICGETASNPASVEGGVRWPAIYR